MEALFIPPPFLSLDGLESPPSKPSAASLAKSEHEPDSPFPFLSLPEEIALLVMCRFEAPELLRLSECSKDMRRLSTENVIWKRVAKRKWKVSKTGAIKRSFPGWKFYYAQKMVLDRPSGFSWHEMKPTGELPTKRYQHTASAVGKYIYFIGGQELPEKRFDEIYRLDTETMGVERVTPRRGTPPKFARHSAVTIMNRIYTFGGFDGVSQHYTLCMYDTDTNEWSFPITTGDQPMSRTNHAAAALGHRMFMFGGMFKESHDRLVFLNDFYVLDAISGVWTKIQAKGVAPEPRCGHRMLAFGNKLLLFGGGSGEQWDKKFNDVFMYDPQENMWTKPQLTDSAQVCTFSIAFSVGTFLFVFGGQNITDNSLTNELYVLDTMTWVWQKITPSNANPSARDMSSGTILGNSMFMFGGYSGTAVESFWTLQVPPALQNPFTKVSPSPSQ